MFKNVQEDSRKLNKAQEGSRRFKQVQEGLLRVQELRVLECTKRLKKA